MKERKRERKKRKIVYPNIRGPIVDVLVFSANWEPRWRNPHEIGDGSATLRNGCGPSSPSVTSVLIRVGPRGCHPINGANNVALHLHTSNKSHDIWLVSPRHLRASVHPFVYFTAPCSSTHTHTHTHTLSFSHLPGFIYFAQKTVTRRPRLLSFILQLPRCSRDLVGNFDFRKLRFSKFRFRSPRFFSSPHP